MSANDITWCGTPAYGACQHTECDRNPANIINTDQNFFSFAFFHHEPWCLMTDEERTEMRASLDREMMEEEGHG